MRSARQLLLTTRWVRANFQSGDQVRIGFEGEVDRRAEGLSDRLRRSFLLGGFERRRAGRLQSDGRAGRRLPRGRGQRADRRQRPVEKHARARPDRPAARPDAWRCPPPDRTSGSPRPVSSRPRLSRRPLSPPRPSAAACFAASDRFRRAGAFRFGWASARILSRSSAKPARVLLDVGERGSRPCRVSACASAKAFCAAARRSAIMPAIGRQKNRCSSQTRMTMLTVWRPSVHQSMVIGYFSRGLANSSSSATTRQ